MKKKFWINEEERKKTGRTNARASGNIKLICLNCKKEHVVNGCNIGFLYWNSERNSDGKTANIFLTRLPIECDCGQNIVMNIRLCDYPPPTLFDFPEYTLIGAERQGEFSIEFYR